MSKFLIIETRDQMRKLFVDLVERLPIEIGARSVKYARTNDQNARLWWMHGLFAAFLNRKLPELIKSGLVPKPFRFTPESVHEGIFKPHYIGTLPNGMTKSSTQLTRAEFSAILESYEADMRNDGIEFPDNEPWS